MNDELYSKLSEKQPTREEMYEYAYALKELAEGLTAHSLMDVLRHANQALLYLDEFLGNIIPTPILSVDEGNFGVEFHTYMRKGMDCPLGTMLYHLIAANKGLPIWYAFVKSVVASKDKRIHCGHIYQNAIKAAEDTYRTGQQTNENLMMLCALQMWEDDFNNIIGATTKLCSMRETQKNVNV